MIDTRAGSEVNVRADAYWIARTVSVCPQCRGMTRLVALMLPPDHATLSFCDESPMEGRNPLPVCEDLRTPGNATPDHVQTPVEATLGGRSGGGANGRSASDTWERAPLRALLFYIEYLPEAVRGRLQALAPGYRRAFSPATQGAYWANHCDQCDGLHEDHDLFCEPEGAFLPVSPAAASAIELLSIAEPIHAAATGYAQNPEFLEFAAGA